MGTVDWHWPLLLPAPLPWSACRSWHQARTTARGVCSKQNWYPDLPRPDTGWGPVFFSRLIQASGPRPTIRRASRGSCEAPCDARGPAPTGGDAPQDQLSAEQARDGRYSMWGDWVLNSGHVGSVFMCRVQYPYLAC